MQTFGYSIKSKPKIDQKPKGSVYNLPFWQEPAGSKSQGVDGNLHFVLCM